jgi:glycine betaine/proline transport system substrate-binding protein
MLGWYIPRYVLTDVPDALFGDFADPDVAAYFNNTVYVGDQDWLSIQYEIIAQNNFSLNVVELPGEDELMDLLYTHYEQKQPLLFYFWSPHLLPAHIQLIRVQLPNDSKKFLK